MCILFLCSLQSGFSALCLLGILLMLGAVGSVLQSAAVFPIMCCVPCNVLCCLVLAAFPVFCFSLNIALADA